MPVPAAIQEYLDQRGCVYTPVPHPRAYTAQEEAAVTHTPGHLWAKTVVCFVDDEPVLAVMGADRKLDLESLRRLAGGQTARLAREAEFAALYRDCEVGAMPPFGDLFGQRVFVDQRLAQSREITFHAGTHMDGIRMAYATFAELARPVVGDFTWHV
jgi:Ala-tRNA(Pro) deacylase